MFLILAMTSSSGQAQTAKPQEKPIRAIGWLAGGVWTADASKLGPGMQRIETRYEWADNGSYLHFTTHFVFDKGTLKNYDGNFFWDPQKNALTMWYMDANGGITQGLMDWSADVLRITWRGPDFDGKVADLKVEVTRKSDDHYHWAAFEKEGDTWKEVAALEYVRAADKAPAKSS
jgi:hypothetical protein